MKEPLMIKILNPARLGIVLATALSSSLLGAAAADSLAPRNDAEVKQRVEQLRQKNEP